MCVFCAAIPAAVSVGATVKVKQSQKIRLAEECGEPSPRVVVPAWRATGLVISGLVVCSVIYHTHLGAF